MPIKLWIKKNKEGYYIPYRPAHDENDKVGKGEYEWKVSCENCLTSHKYFVEKGYERRKFNPECPNCGCKTRLSTGRG